MDIKKITKPIKNFAKDLGNNVRSSIVSTIVNDLLRCLLFIGMLMLANILFCPDKKIKIGSPDKAKSSHIYQNKKVENLIEEIDILRQYLNNRYNIQQENKHD